MNTLKASFATHTYLKNVSTLALDTTKCNGCGRCVDVCPHGVFELNTRKSAIVSKDSCMECGACSKNCATGALSVNPGVGCAAAIIQGWITGSEPSCGCDDSTPTKSKKGGCC